MFTYSAKVIYLNAAQGDRFRPVSYFTSEAGFRFVSMFFSAGTNCIELQVYQRGAICKI